MIVGALKVNFWVSLLGATGMVSGPAYMLVLLRAVLFDKFTRPNCAGYWTSAGGYRHAVPLAVMVLWLGVYPSSFTIF